ncbi:Copper transport protein CCH [Arachis hypogaea]|nr:Copper transport protein CCH [Arachis hypogaea]
MSSQTVVLKVGMSCQGCVGAVNRVLGKMEGVESFDINLKEQKVTVKGNVEPEAVLQTVAKTGKKTAFWENEAPALPTQPETSFQKMQLLLLQLKLKSSLLKLLPLPQLSLKTRLQKLQLLPNSFMRLFSMLI